MGIEKEAASLVAKFVSILAIGEGKETSLSGRKVLGGGMDIDEACSRAKRGNCVLFLGSGFGFYGRNADDEKLPTGEALGDMLRKLLGEDSSIGLARAADIAAEELNPADFDSFLRRKLTPVSSDPRLSQLVNLPWARVYTTNYDNLYEMAASAVGVKSNTLTPSSPVSPSHSYTDVVHIHGALSSGGMARDGLVLGDESYLRSEFISSPWYHIFLNDISSAKSIIFVGYSMSDMDLGRIIISRPDLIDKTCVITGPDLNDRERRRLSKFGSVYSVGVDGLNEALASSPDAEQVESLPFISLSKVNLPESVLPATSKEAFDLFGLGVLSPSAFISQIRDGSIYSLGRQAFDRIISGAERGVTRILIHSHFGNGKSILLEQLSLGLAEKGFDVFIVGVNSFSLDEELARVWERGGKRAIIFDNALRQRQYFISACTQMPSDVLVVGATRTLNFNTEYQRLFQIINGLTEYDLNELKTPELQDVSNSLTYFGFWGEGEIKSDEQKVSILRNQCRSEISSTVLHLLENSSISRQIELWIHDLKSADDRLMSVIISALIFAKANISLSLEEVVTLGGVDIYWFQSQAKDSVVGEVLNLGGGGGRVRSPVLADYILRKSFQLNIIMESLWRILKKLHENYDLNEYQFFARQLLKLSFLTTLFGNDRKSDMIVSFYDNVRTLSSFRGDPQFWVQFAMVRVERGEWKLAETYFANAYSYASKGFKNYKTFMVDDQYARFLLISRSDGYKPEDAYASFLKAIRIVQNALKDDASDVYPFRTAAYVQPFIASVGPSMKDAEKQVAIVFCRNIVSLIDRADTRVSHFGEMRDCRAAMESVLQQMSS